MPRKPSRNVNPSVAGEPSYRRHRASGQAIVTLSGKDVYLGVFGSKDSREKYRAALDAWIARGRRPEHRAVVARRAFTVADLIDKYMDHCRGYYRKPGPPGPDGEPTTELNVKEIWNIGRALRPLRDLFGVLPAGHFGPAKLEQVRDKHVADGLCRSVVNRYIRRAQHVFKWGVAKELVPAAVWHALSAFEPLRRGRTPARETDPIRPVPDAFVDATRPHVAAPVAAMIQIQQFTGARPGEICMMRACDLDTTGKIWLYTPMTHKTAYAGRERKIAIGPRAQAVLRPILAKIRDVRAYLFSPIEAVEERRAIRSAARKTPPMQGNRPGTNVKRRPQIEPHDHYCVDAYRRAIERGCDRAFPLPESLAKQPGETASAWRSRLTDDEHDQVRAWRREHRWHPNQLRHSFGTRVRRDFGLEEAQTALGHSRADVTQIYAERDLAAAMEVAEKIG